VTSPARAVDTLSAKAVPKSVETLVVPYDGSRFAARALPVAVRLVERLGSGIHLVSAVATEDEVPQRTVLLEAVELPVARVDRTVVVGLDLAGVVHETLRRVGSSVACLASHARNRTAALIGSVATNIVARGHDPVIVVGPIADREQMVEGVVACVDETIASAALVPVALRWAELLHTHATAITVAEPVPPPLTTGPPRRRFGPNDDVDGYLQWMVAPLRANGANIATKAVYNPISPADGLDHYLSANPSLLVVIGSTARLGISRVVFGSTAAKFVQRSTSPVLVVPRRLFDAAPA